MDICPGLIFIVLVILVALVTERYKFRKRKP